MVKYRVVALDKIELNIQHTAVETEHTRPRTRHTTANEVNQKSHNVAQDVNTNTAPHVKTKRVGKPNKRTQKQTQPARPALKTFAYIRYRHVYSCV